MSFDPLPNALAAEIDRAVAAAPAGAEQVTVELAASPDGRVTPSPRRVNDPNPYARIEMTLQPIDPLKVLQKLLPEGLDVDHQPPN